MRRVTEDKVNQISSICKSHAFPTLIDWLQENRQEKLELMTKTRDVISLHQLQGQAIMLADLIDTLTAIAKK